MNVAWFSIQLWMSLFSSCFSPAWLGPCFFSAASLLLMGASRAYLFKDCWVKRISETPWHRQYAYLFIYAWMLICGARRFSGLSSQRHAAYHRCIPALHYDDSFIFETFNFILITSHGYILAKLFWGNCHQYSRNQMKKRSLSGNFPMSGGRGG